MTGSVRVINPQFKIHGKERRAMKKELSLLRRDYRSFDYQHSLHKDMCVAYGGDVMTDEEAKDCKYEMSMRIACLEVNLAEQYTT